MLCMTPFLLQCNLKFKSTVPWGILWQNRNPSLGSWIQYFPHIKFTLGSAAVRGLPLTSSLCYTPSFFLILFFRGRHSYRARLRAHIDQCSTSFGKNVEAWRLRVDGGGQGSRLLFYLQPSDFRCCAELSGIFDDNTLPAQQLTKWSFSHRWRVFPRKRHRLEGTKCPACLLEDGAGDGREGRPRRCWTPTKGWRRRMWR